MRKVKFSFSPEGEKLLERLAKEEGISEEEVISRALKLYEFIKEDVYHKGKKLGILDKNNQLETILEE